MHKFNLTVGFERAVHGVVDKSIRILVISGLALSAAGVNASLPIAQASTSAPNEVSRQPARRIACTITRAASRLRCG
jgi:hypothetical protein